MEMFSGHTLEGWMEGYLLTGRHALFHTYEAFAHIIDSIVNQHAKWLEKAKPKFNGAPPFPRSTYSLVPPYGIRTITALPIRTPVSSTW